ncbi:MAG TPA: PilX N-terminal domain-containing pilus assembly protein [Gammaproteobacteria bacterium]|nr:PilX N-terminal domain-containing pilus assembly protein [Gammaproteobacteria bacterium]
MNHSRDGLAPKSKQTGATLIVGLILLLVLTVLGVSTMNTSRMEVRMAGNTQFRQDAFQLAESGIDIAIAAGTYNTTSTPTTSDCPDVPDAPDLGCEAETTFRTATPLSDVAFSMGNVAGGGSVMAYHFDVVSQSTAPRNAKATHRQSFYVLGPGTQGNQP